MQNVERKELRKYLTPAILRARSSLRKCRQVFLFPVFFVCTNHDQESYLYTFGLLFILGSAPYQLSCSMMCSEHVAVHSFIQTPMTGHKL